MGIAHEKVLDRACLAERLSVKIELHMGYLNNSGYVEVRTYHRLMAHQRRYDQQ